jgi:predicted peroxiredoxin
MNTTTTTTTNTAADSKVLIGLTHGADEAENVLIAYLMGVEALRAGKEAVMWLTKDGINVGIDGFADNINIEGAPAVSDLHDEYVNSGGRFLVCPVCVKVRGEQGAVWAKNAVVAGAPAVYEYTAGGALVFNY